jgi:hypothetical protein
MSDADRPETELQRRLRELAELGPAAISERTKRAAADIERVLSGEGRRLIASAEGLLLDLGHHLDVVPTTGPLRIPFKTPADYRDGMLRYGVLYQVDPEASSPLGFEVLALQVWINQYEAAHFDPPGRGH